MAEALAVVGIVANIVQLVDFGSRVLKRLEEYQSSLAEIPEAFRHLKAELPMLLDALQQTKAGIDAGSMQDETKKALVPAVEGCGVQIKALNEVIAKALPASGDSWARRGGKAIGSLRYDAKVQKITAIIRGYIQTLTYHAAISLRPLAVPQSHPAPCSTTPFQRDPHFVDRSILAEIDFKNRQSTSRLALVGLGGVGKSQIAIEYSYRVRDKSQDTWVFWVHADTQARFEEGYRRIAETVKVEGWDNPKADVLRLVRSWMCDGSNRQWVLVVDNADDLGVFFHNRSQTRGADSLDRSVELLSDFLPQSPNGLILITSRSQDVAYRLTGSYASIMKVQPMDWDEALTLLQKKLSPNTDQHNAIKLLQALDYMPLAITQAAAYIEQRAPRMTISRYLDVVCRSDYDRARLLKKDVGDSRRDGRASNSIITTWQISFEYIRKEMPTAARLLSLMSLFDRQGIPDSLLHNQYQQDKDEEADFEEDIHTLTSYSLVGMNADGREFKMHRLVQFSMKKWLELNQELEQWKEEYVRLMDNSYPVGKHKNWALCQALFPHAQAAVGCRPTSTKALEEWASVLFKAAWYAGEIGQYNVAKEMGASALQAREATLGAEHPDTLNSINGLGVILSRQGKYKEAQAMNRRALGGCEKTLGKEHPDTLTCVSNLALVLQHEGKYEAAEEMNRRALEGREKTVGKEHPDTLISVNNLALVLQHQGKYEAAEKMSRQVLEGREKTLGKEHPSTLTSVSNVAAVLRCQGKYDAAEEMSRRVLEGREKTVGKEHPSTLTSVSNLALVLQHQGKYEVAEEMNQRVLEGREKTLGKEHPDTLTSVSNLAFVLQHQGRYEVAEEMSRRALEGREKMMGKEHPSTLTSVSNVASVLQYQGKYEAAEEMSRQALEGREKTLGKEHPSTLTSVSNVASVLQYQGKYEAAEEMSRRALEGREKTLGKEHPDTLTSVSWLAFLYHEQQKYEAASVLYQRASSGFDHVLGSEHPITVSCARLYSCLKQEMLEDAGNVGK
ncbi:TPR-like protein [Lindgomyces ingoldianus]|uniref:TPR-like protein n=1 Tax=Lindgomyces ingoldianus TaxID=673940 RepID=A0ACB6QB00_9PLEO|nr:TPR-like protein [Lindgomyces ingoldianus]KAF2464103.1 TPR-like protein [Lindgomyces ingoldianus]